jgi:YD repeat-containing protein
MLDLFRELKVVPRHPCPCWYSREAPPAITAARNYTTFSYDAAGRRTAVANALGNTTTTIFDADGQVTATVNALNQRTTFVYDAAGHQTVQIDYAIQRSTITPRPIGIGHSDN